MNTLSNQVQIEELKIGEGVEALKGALVFIHFEGRLEDGTVFDSTAKHNRPFECVVGSKKIIPGLSSGLLGMKEGGKRKVFIPSELAYGEREVGGLIKPHSNLIFEIELLEARNRD